MPRSVGRVSPRSHYCSYVVGSSINALIAKWDGILARGPQHRKSKLQGIIAAPTRSECLKSKERGSPRAVCLPVNVGLRPFPSLSFLPSFLPSFHGQNVTAAR